MKKIILFFLLSFLELNIFAQQTAAEVEKQVNYEISLNKLLFWTRIPNPDSIRQLKIKTITQYLKVEGSAQKIKGKSSIVTVFNENGFEMEYYETANRKKTTEMKFAYDETNKIKTVLTFWNGKLVSTDSLFYNQHGIFYRVTRRNTDGTTEQLIETYNSDKKEISFGQSTLKNSILYLSFDSTGKCDTLNKSFLERDEKGRITAYYYYTKPHPADGHEQGPVYGLMGNFYQYDSNDFVIKKTERNSYFHAITTYTYDNNNHLSREDEIFDDSIKSIKVHRFSVDGKFDTMVSPRGIAKFLPQEPRFESLSREITVYNERGQKTLWESYFGTVEKMYPSEAWQSKFDAQGRLLEYDHAVSNKQSDGFVFTALQKSIYDKEGLLISHSFANGYENVNDSNANKFITTYKYSFYK